MDIAKAHGNPLAMLERMRLIDAALSLVAKAKRSVALV